MTELSDNSSTLLNVALKNLQALLTASTVPPNPPEELADVLELPKEKVTDTLKVSGRHVSVDAPFIEGEDNSLLDVLTNSDSPVADKLLMDESLSREIYRALATLTERERDIILSLSVSVASAL